jgi:hypothetical protein
LVEHSRGVATIVVVWVIEFALGNVPLEEKEILTILEAMERYDLAEMATVTMVWDTESGED